MQDSPGYLPNVEALRQAQPRDLDASEIEVRLGATWIDPSYIREFMWETFETPFYQQRMIDVNYSAFTAEWNIRNKNAEMCIRDRSRNRTTLTILTPSPSGKRF